MIPAVFIFVYLGIVFYIGVFAFRHTAHRDDAEDFFLASRQLGPLVFLVITSPVEDGQEAP